MSRTRLFVAAALLVALTVPLALAQPPDTQRQVVDRRQFLNEVQTSDDPRRVPAPPGPRGPEGTRVLYGGFIFDGTGVEPRIGTLVIERNRIAAILGEGERGWPEGSQVLDVSGHTVMPGLIDLHTHLTYTEPGVPQVLAVDPVHQTLRAMERLHVFIGAGITSIRDTGSAGTVPFIVKDWVNQNRLPGPRVFASGSLITGTGGHGAEGYSIHHPLYGGIVEASGPDEFRDAVREQFKMGADLIKLASHYSREEIAAAVDEAHALGLKVTVDSETFYTGWAVEAGADEIDIVISREHVLRGNWAALYAEVREMRRACGDAHMKTILATGELGPLWQVARASKVCLMAGADFIKTSTGKESINATLEVGLTMTREIRAYQTMTGCKVGFKPAGGIRSAKDALNWLILIKEELGDEWLNSQRFRFGASGLLTDIERQLSHHVSGRYAARHHMPMA